MTAPLLVVVAALRLATASPTTEPTPPPSVEAEAPQPSDTTGPPDDGAPSDDPATGAADTTETDPAPGPPPVETTEQRPAEEPTTAEPAAPPPTAATPEPTEAPPPEPAPDDATAPPSSAPEPPPPAAASPPVEADPSGPAPQTGAPAPSPPPAPRPTHEESLVPAATPAPAPPAPAPAPTAPAPMAEPTRDLPLFLNPVPSAEEWLGTLLPRASAPASTPAEAAPALGVFPSPADLVAHGPAVAWRRLLWLLAAALTATLAARLARRRPPGPARIQLVRVTALARTVAAISLVGTAIALLPVQWLPWLALVAASAAIAVGWSLRPLVADLLAGIYLGVLGRHAPGAPVRVPSGAARVHRPGLLRTVVRTEAGTLEAHPNRRLAVAGPSARRAGRTRMTVRVELEPGGDDQAGLRAIRLAVDLLPWTATDVSPVLTPHTSEPGVWLVQLVVLGEPPPLERVYVELPRLVRRMLQRGETRPATSGQ